MTTPAFAADWTTYANSRYGESIDIPPGFVNDVPPPTNDDGRTFHSGDGKAELLVWGNNLVIGNFKQDALGDMMSERENQWLITYERGANADLKKPGAAWYVYSGSKDGRVMYAKSIAACHGRQALHFRIEYPQDQLAAYAAIVSRLAVSLKAGPAIDCAKG